MRISVLLVGLGLATCGVGCAEVGDEVQGGAPLGEDESAVAEQRIIHGMPQKTNSFVAAIYKANSSLGSGYFGSHHCSGVVLRRGNGETLVLTAQHCVVDEQSKAFQPSLLKVTTAVDYGYSLSTSEASAANTGTVKSITRKPNYVTYGDDMALVVVDKELTVTEYPRLVLNMPTTSLKAGDALVAYGYGAYTDTTYSWSAPGWLRSTSNILVNRVYSEFYLLRNQGTGDGAGDGMITHGDSGGPDVLVNTQTIGSTAYTWNTLMGVHHGSYGGSDDFGISIDVAGSWDWIQTNGFKYFYLSNADGLGSGNVRLSTSTPLVGSTLVSLYGLYTPSDTVNSRWAYVASSGELRSGSTTGLCLQATANSVSLQSCNAANSQKWDFVAANGARRLKNRGNKNCLKNANYPGLGPCGAESFPLLIHTQP